MPTADSADQCAKGKSPAQGKPDDPHVRGERQANQMSHGFAEQTSEHPCHRSDRRTFDGFAIRDLWLTVT